MGSDVGRVTGSRATHRAASAGVSTEGFDPAREERVQRIIMAISTASVPHESHLPGALESRSLSYYLGVGIDHFQHDYERHEALLRKAAEQALAASAIEARSDATTQIGAAEGESATAESGDAPPLPASPKGRKL